MLARFIGDPRNGGDGPRLVSTFGFEFIKGDWRDVSDECALKLVGNDHFEVEGLTVAKVTVVEETFTRDDLAAWAREGFAAFDGDGDGRLGGFAGPTDEALTLRAALDAKGIKYHHKAGVAKLRALLEA